jgi:ABC-type multidrug transport system fused ATPase/permease subunit
MKKEVMNKNNSSLYMQIFRLWSQISKRRKRQFFFLIILIIFVSFAEVVSIGLVIPFLGAITNPISVFKVNFLHKFLIYFNITKPNEIILPITLLFIFAIISAAVLRLTLLWATTKLSFAAGSDLSISIYRKTLHQPYLVHVSRNSSDTINTISIKANAVIGVLLMLLNLIGTIVILITITTTLIIINPIVAFVSIFGSAFFYIIIGLITRRELQINSLKIASESTNVIKSLQEGLGGIRDILLDGTQETYCGIYNNSEYKLRKAQSSNSFISNSPKFIMEAVGMSLIAVIAYFLVSKSANLTTSNAIPILGVLAIGAQRMLPILQQGFIAWSTIKGSSASINDTLELLEQPMKTNLQKDIIFFNTEICLKNIKFQYNNEGPIIINNLELKINKGDRIGFIGETGCGKSTLLDIVMGLVPPSSGQILVDGVPLSEKNVASWHKNIAHVPQIIFLSDSSISENIAFGIPKDQIDFSKVVLAAKNAQLDEIINTWENKYNTIVGERGVRLSGGQRQRIGIARALYKNANVLIFDEATSALDNNTEESVMSTIDLLNNNFTIIMVAHRISTLKNCDQIVELSSGKINRILKYNDLIK